MEIDDMDMDPAAMGGEDEETIGGEEPLSLDEVLAQLEAEELEEKEKIEKMEEGNA
jgi:hypothetical protein